MESQYTELSSREGFTLIGTEIKPPEVSDCHREIMIGSALMG